MYPTIYHAVLDIFGFDWPWMKLLNSFGFFVALAFVAANFLLLLEMKRKDKMGLFEKKTRKVIVGGPVNWSDVLFNAGLGFFFGWKVIYLLMNAGELFTGDTLPQQHIFSGDGNWFLGLLLGAGFGGFKYWEYKKNQLDEPQEKEYTIKVQDYVGPITFIAAIGGVVGAKFFHLFENPDEFLLFFKEPSLENFLSGLTIYGGLIIGSLAVWLYTRTKGLPFIHVTDAAAPGLILSYGIGRIGCQVSGDGDWGIANLAPKPSWMGSLPDWLWTYSYPNNVNGVGMKIPADSGYEVYEGYGRMLEMPVFPTPIYETMMATIIFLILWQLRKRIQIPGLIFAIYLMFNGFERFWIEKIRVNNVFDFLGMSVTQAEVISTLTFFGGIALAVYVVMKSRRVAT